ncbi:hypothetical protein BDP81DRAFT_214665 [Colletotrichum phormii]|uniref:Uncharacterized protein n=1 Tax=Colletotrichum phormii TaxID=359342 RepID=A0AAI9ZTJ4_9PEZI|nr:uncharacterized protein BDP81DRAFT_214665 [Colletotrichum phormii]KAK1637858.1 hypothetical protein BDP81DRAFT_214665 [Colletotrichum phormii]
MISLGSRTNSNQKRRSSSSKLFNPHSLWPIHPLGSPYLQQANLRPLTPPCSPSSPPDARMPLLARHGSSRRVYSPALLCQTSVNTHIHTRGHAALLQRKKLWSRFRGTAMKNLLARGVVSFHRQLMDVSESYQEQEVPAAGPEFQPRHMSLSRHSRGRRDSLQKLV